MSNLKGMNYKEFAVNHGEKIVLGFVALFVVFAIFTSKWTTEKRTPLELSQKVETAESQVKNSQWPEEQRKEFLKDDDLREKVSQLIDKGIEVTNYQFSHPLSWRLYAKKERAKEVDWMPIEDLVATYGRFIMMTRPLDAAMEEGAEGSDSKETEEAKPDEPEYNPFKKRTNVAGAGMGGPGGSAMAGLTFGNMPNAEADMMAAGGPGGYDPGGYAPPGELGAVPDGSMMEMGMSGGMAGPAREGRGLRFIAVRGVFDLATQQDKLERSLGDAYSMQNMQAGRILEFLDFQLQRQKIVPGANPAAGKWEDVDIETSIEVLKESADFDPEVVNTGITDRVFTMPLPSRIAGFWYKVATHPRVENFTLSQEEIEQELEFNRLVLDQYKKSHAGERVFKEKQKGFSNLQLGMREIRSQFMSDGQPEQMDSVFQGMASSMQQIRPGEELDEKKLIQKLKANVTAAGRLLLFRYFDFDLNPGETYKYRVRLVVRNPNFQRPIEEVVLPAVAEGETRMTPWSNETAAVTAEQDVYYYLQNVRPPRGANGITAQFEVFQWYPKTGTTIHSFLKTAVGDEIGGEQSAELYDVAKEEYDEKATVQFDTQNYLVDAIPSPSIRLEDHPDLNLPRQTRGHLPIDAEAIIVDNLGNLKSSKPPAASETYTYAKNMFDRERQSLAWVKEAAEARASAPTDAFGFGAEESASAEYYGLEGDMMGRPQKGKKSKRKKNPIRVGP
ncbi:hypothetical protein [Gimesia alba]|nr:hypothetical protein [Gimesia alba]